MDQKEKIEEVQVGTQFTVSKIIGFLNEFETPSWVFERLIEIQKQYLIEYLLFGLNVEETKTLTKEVDNGSKVEFSLDARTWNKMLIGNAVGVEGGICKYFEQNSEEERLLTFGLLCKDWEVNIEIVFDDYEDYEQHSFSIKNFDGYYT